MKEKLTRLDFKEIKDTEGIYYSYSESHFVILVKPCLKGYDVQILSKVLIMNEPKICTSINENIDKSLNRLIGYSQNKDNGFDKYWNAALKEVNNLYIKYLKSK